MLNSGLWHLVDYYTRDATSFERPDQEAPFDYAKRQPERQNNEGILVFELN